MAWISYTTQLPGIEKTYSLRRIIDRTSIILLVKIHWAPATQQWLHSMLYIHFLISFSQPCSGVGLIVFILQMRLREDKVTRQSLFFLCDRVRQNPVCLILQARLFLLEMEQNIHEMSAHKIGMFVCSELIPALLRLTTTSVFFFYHMSLGTTVRFRTPGCPEIWSYPVWDLSYSSVLWPHGLHKAQHQSSLPWNEF